MNYTKGEWKAKERLNDNCIRIISTLDGSFQTHIIGEVFGTHGEDLANAHLIAAAPALYRALKNVHKDYDSNYWPSALNLEQAAKALAKAEGREE